MVVVHNLNLYMIHDIFADMGMKIEGKELIFVFLSKHKTIT